ncbi:MAG: hypothetical protein KBF96_07190 [Ignavibacteria bacterium]|nr:hypothetical protein [Ignavibacteria bacterium]
MTEKLKYKFNCAQFHSNRRNYVEFRNCTFITESDEYDSIKAEVLAHLMQQKPKETAEHHYQDYTNLNVEADVDSYLSNPDGDS